MASVPQLMEQPFRFMDMARELRDLVYDELYQDEDVQPLKDRCFIVESAPIASLLRVSQDFSAEYADRIWKQTTLVFTGTPSTAPSSAAVRQLAEGSLKLIQKGRAKLWIWCPQRRCSRPRCNMNRGLEEAIKRLQVPHLPIFDVELLAEGIPKSSQWPDTGPHFIKPLLRRFARGQKVGKIRMLRCDLAMGEAGQARYEIMASHATEYVSWTMKEGWKAAELIEEVDAHKST